MAAGDERVLRSCGPTPRPHSLPIPSGAAALRYYTVYTTAITSTKLRHAARKKSIYGAKHASGTGTDRSAYCLRSTHAQREMLAKAGPPSTSASRTGRKENGRTMSVITAKKSSPLSKGRGEEGGRESCRQSGRPGERTHVLPELRPGYILDSREAHSPTA